MFKLFKKCSLKTIDKFSVDKEIEKFTELGVSDNDVIVSLTSFPERMYEIHYTLYSLLTQTYKPSKVVLWLAKEQFPNLEKDIPEKVLMLKENGLTINWCSNLYSYKKLIPSLKEYPNHIIVTADDDVFYDKEWLERLVLAHKKHSNCIICHRAHKIKLNKDIIAPYKKWKKCIKGSDKASYLNFLTGIGGVLYPANCFYKDVLNENLFNEIVPKADDVWFWAMAVLNGYKILVPKNYIKDVRYLNPERERGLTNEITLFSMNKKGGNDLQLAKLIEYYPQILELIKK